MSMPKSANETIHDIVKYIDNGEYRIPRFQRDFVWDIKKSASLLDSIFKGYPISSVIIWKTKNELSEIRNLGGIEIPGKDTGRYTSYIIDGQQRLTSLYFALKGLKTESGSDFSTMCVSLTASKTEQLVFDKLPKDANYEDYVLIKELFSASALEGNHQKKRLEYYNILLQYMISVIDIDDEKLGLDEVVEIFERLNLGGKKLNLFSIIAARSYQPGDDNTKEFDLAKKLEAFNKKLADNNYGQINESIFLQSIAACLIGKVNKADILRNLKSSLIIKNYKKVENAISEAIEHLKGNNYGVLVANLLPYQAVIVTFTYFHFIQGTKPITSTQEGYLVDYFWRCVLGKRYTRSADTNLNSDILKTKKILEDEKPAQEPIALSPQSIIENGRFSLTSAYVKGLLCLMALMNPQAFLPGRKIVITNDSITNSAAKQYHHFFPLQSQVIKENSTYKSNANNIVNIVFMDALTNKQIYNRNPSDYTKECSEKNNDFESILNSHFISLQEFGLDNDDFFTFMNNRGLRLYQKLKEYIIPTKHDTINENQAF